MTDSSPSSRIGVLCAIVGVLLACSNDGGANAGQHTPGNAPGGVTVGIGDIAVSPSNDFVIFERDDALAVGWTDTGVVRTLPVSDPTRLVFARHEDVVYAGSLSPADHVVAIDVRQRAVRWDTSIADAHTTELRLVATGDDSRLLAAEVSDGSVKVLDARTGTVERTIDLSSRIVDVQVLPDDKRALFVLAHTFQSTVASTTVVVVSLDTGERVSITVPNCSDRITVRGDGLRAFLAPTTCRKDPISVIDLTAGHEMFVKNLPGFGPVALSRARDTVVGFLDRTLVDSALFADPSRIPGASTARYHLMLIDANTLSYDFVEASDHLPRFAVTPDGNVLLVDSSYATNVPARLLDVPSRSWKSIDGAPLLLDDFAISSDSGHAYVIETHFYDGLYDLDVGAATSTQIPLPFSPRNLNISADDQTLYLRKTDDEVCVFSLAMKTCRARFVEPPLVSGR